LFRVFHPSICALLIASSVSSLAVAANANGSKQSGEPHDYELTLLAVQTVSAAREKCSKMVGTKQGECVDLEFDRAAMRVSAIAELIPKGTTPHDFAMKMYDRFVRINGEMANTP
jgi:hypothetical protein